LVVALITAAIGRIWRASARTHDEHEHIHDHHVD
jgi:hypothetical protein